jgi:hypothetical protein
MIETPDYKFAAHECQAAALPVVRFIHQDFQLLGHDLDRAANVLVPNRDAWFITGCGSGEPFKISIHFQFS